MRCCVPFCKTNAELVCGTEEITFHRLPSDVPLRAAWLRALGNEDTNLPDSAVVCSQHFLNDDMYNTKSGLREIRTGAIPSMVQVCMICLDTHSKLSLMSKYKLEEAYESLLGKPLRFQGNVRQTLCVQCAQRLVNFSRFRENSLRARSMMMELVEKHNLITIEHFISGNCEKYQLKPDIVVTIFEPNHCDLYISHSDNNEQTEDSSEPNVGIVAVKNEGIDQTMSVDKDIALHQIEQTELDLSEPNNEMVAVKNEEIHKPMSADDDIALHQIEVQTKLDSSEHNIETVAVKNEESDQAMSADEDIALHQIEVDSSGPDVGMAAVKNEEIDQTMSADKNIASHEIDVQTELDSFEHKIETVAVKNEESDQAMSADEDIAIQQIEVDSSGPDVGMAAVKNEEIDQTMSADKNIASHEIDVQTELDSFEHKIETVAVKNEESDQAMSADEDIAIQQIEVDSSGPDVGMAAVKNEEIDQTMSADKNIASHQIDVQTELDSFEHKIETVAVKNEDSDQAMSADKDIALHQKDVNSSGPNVEMAAVKNEEIDHTMSADKNIAFHQIEVQTELDSSERNIETVTVKNEDSDQAMSADENIALHQIEVIKENHYVCNLNEDYVAYIEEYQPNDSIMLEARLVDDGLCEAPKAKAVAKRVSKRNNPYKCNSFTFACYLCFKQFAVEHDYDEHMRIHVQRPEPKLVSKLSDPHASQTGCSSSVPDKMPSQRKRSTEGSLCLQCILDEARNRIEGGESQRKVASSYGIKESTLRYRLKRPARLFIPSSNGGAVRTRQYTCACGAARVSVV